MARQKGGNGFNAKEWLDKKLERMEQTGSNAVTFKELIVNGIPYNLRVAKSQNEFIRLELRRSRARFPTIRLSIPQDADAIIEFAKILKEKYNNYYAILQEIAKRNGVSGVSEIEETTEDEYL